MALLSLSLSLPSSASPLVGPSSLSGSTSSSSGHIHQISVRPPSPVPLMPCLTFRRTVITSSSRRWPHVVRMAPEEEKMTRRSPLDFPIEWERPKPGRRPDIFPQFSPMKTPLPPPMPADPPEEEDEEEEEKKEEEEEDPEKEDPDKPDEQ